MQPMQISINQSGYQAKTNLLLSENCDKFEEEVDVISAVEAMPHRQKD